VFPKHHNLFALRIVVDAGSVHQRRLARTRRLIDSFDEPPALSQMNELPRLRQLARCGQSTGIGYR